MDRFSNIYVINKMKSYINKFVPKKNTYEYYGKFGTNPFINIKSIAADWDSSIFLLNGSSREIIKIDKDGWELARFGGKGAQDGKFKKPISIVAGKGGEFIYVLDKSKKQVLQFSNSGEFLGMVVSKRSGKLKEPIDIDSDRKGNLYVLDGKASACFVYNHSGGFITQIGEKDKNGYKPAKVASDPWGRYVYIYYFKKTKILGFNFGIIKGVIKKYDKNGTYLTHHKVGLPKEHPTLKVNNYRRLMVDTYTHIADCEKIDFLKTDGAMSGMLPALPDEGKFKTVKDITVDDVDNIYILNNYEEIYVFKQSRLF